MEPHVFKAGKPLEIALPFGANFKKDPDAKPPFAKGVGGFNTVRKSPSDGNPLQLFRHSHIPHLTQHSNLPKMKPPQIGCLQRVSLAGCEIPLYGDLCL
ncbi:MAG: hypothetical protein JRK53_25875 [Deltaproteobacteria bacterium]|nr:hypothetical protein [Deltaproteobacteria bacterium]MBW1818377.1 hypothetical protein [Deltaproteobacteria bacterium]MBW2283960.1 hypothetical protein [Deltaproteobacteria bacterium]